MRKIVALIVAASMAAVGSIAMAAPHATYDSATGNIHFINDTNPAVIFGAAILKAGANGKPPLGGLPDGSSITGVANPIPGTVLDTGDQPAALTYLDLPVGDHNVGNVVAPGTDINLLSFEYYNGGTSTPVLNGAVEAVGIPEPATLGLAGMSLVALGVRRRNS